MKLVAFILALLSVAGAAEAAHIGGKYGKPWQQVATDTFIPDALGSANQASMTRSCHVAKDAISVVREKFPGFYVAALSTPQTDGSEQPAPQQQTINAWFEYPIGTYTQITFGGSNNGLIPQGGYLWTDAATISGGVPSGSVFCEWTYQTVPSGGTILTNDEIGAGGSALGGLSGANIGTSGVPTTPSAGFTPNTQNIFYGPVAIVAPTLVKGYLLVGDSRAYGVKDAADNTYDRGDMGRWIGPSAAYINAGVSADWEATFQSASLRQSLSNDVAGVISEYGVNDYLNSSASTTGLAADDQRTAARFFGQQVALATIEPNDTSTDSFATLGNQTPSAINANRVTTNDSRRLNPYAPSVDVASGDESSLDSGKWIVNGGANAFTSDGLHANQAGNIAIQTSCTPTCVTAILGAARSATSFNPTLTLGSATYGAAKFGNGLSGGTGFAWGLAPGTTPYTVEAWITTTATTGGVFGQSGVAQLSINASGHLTGAGPTANTGAGSATVNDGNPHFVQLVVNHALTYTCVDGVLDASSTTANGKITQATQAFGVRNIYNSGTGTALANGTVDEVAVFSYPKPCSVAATPGVQYVGTERGLLWVDHLENALTNPILGPAFLGSNAQPQCSGNLLQQSFIGGANCAQGGKSQGSYTGVANFTYSGGAGSASNYAVTSVGVLTNFAAGVPRVTDQGLLIEGANTNSALQSQAFSVSPWVNGALTSVVDNSVAAPDGTTTAATVTEDTTTAAHTLSQPFTSGGTNRNILGSIYLKNTGTRRFVQFGNKAGAKSQWITADMTSCTVTEHSATAGSTLNSFAATSLANGWCKLAVNINSAGTADNFSVAGAASGTPGSFMPSYAGTSLTFVTWGLSIYDVSALTAPTTLINYTYLPTTTVAVTRTADAVTDSWWGGHQAIVSYVGGTFTVAGGSPLNLGAVVAGANTPGPWLGGYVTGVAVQ